MNKRVYRVLSLMPFLLFVCATQVSATPPPAASPITPTTLAKSDILLAEDVTQTGASTTGEQIGSIFGSLLILSFYSFPMSFAETWAFGDPRKAKKRPKKESPGSSAATERSVEPAEALGDEAPDSADEWSSLAKHLPRWMRTLPRVTAGLLAGGLLMIVVVIAGAIAFAIYYNFSGQPEKISEIIPRFAYWFPFALLGMVTDIPFQIVYWENARLRVLLRLVIWWFPRVVIIAFVINPPILQGLDPAATALTVLAIDGILAAFGLGLYAAREQMATNAVQWDSPERQTK